MTTYKFSKKYVFDGKEYESVEFDLEELKGSDLSEARRIYAATGGNAPVPALDSDYAALILARLLKQPQEFFADMPAKDYVALTMMVSHFLLNA